MRNYPHYKQPGSKDCGPTCLKIIAKHYKKTIPLQKLREIAETQRTGSSLLNLSNATEAIGFRSLGVKISLKDLKEAPLPCILHWNKNHHVVLYKIKKAKPIPLPFGEGSGVGSFYISDPAHGLLKYNQQEFV